MDFIATAAMMHFELDGYLKKKKRGRDRRV
jgi:hypothetical protein